MKISLCGSITFLDEMKELEKELRELGFDHVYRPIGIENGSNKEYKEKLTVEEDGARKVELDLIRKHWNKILDSDCILVVNIEKKGIPNYVGGNTFLEMGFAFVTGKPIFLLNPVPDMGYTSEMEGMQPHVINGDLAEIPKYYRLGGE